MFISLSSKYSGYACGIAHAIKGMNAVQDKRTLFFDWVLCTMESITQIVIDDTEIEFDYEMNLGPAHFVPFRNTNLIVSAHDFTSESKSDPATRQRVKETYVRRKERFLDRVQETPSDLYFFRFVQKKEELELEHLLRFHAFITSLRKDRRFTIVIITIDATLSGSSFPSNIVVEHCTPPIPYYDYDVIREWYGTILQKFIT